MKDLRQSFCCAAKLWSGPVKNKNRSPTAAHRRWLSCIDGRGTALRRSRGCRYPDPPSVRLNPTRNQPLQRRRSMVPPVNSPAIKVVKSVREQVSPEEWQTRVDLAACYRLTAMYGMTEMI